MTKVTANRTPLTSSLRLGLRACCFASSRGCDPARMLPPCRPPLLLSLPLHRRGGRILELEPVPRAAGDVGRAETLRYDALAAELAGVAEDPRQEGKALELRAMGTMRRKGYRGRSRSDAPRALRPGAPRLMCNK